MTAHPKIIGFISPPRWFDPTPSELASVCAVPVWTQQAPLPLPEFEYRLEDVARTEPELALCARVLVAAGCELVAQVGTPFAWAGLDSEAAARGRCAAIAEAAGTPVLMTALAIVDALRALGATRVALDCTYFDDAWKDGWTRFVHACGFMTHEDTLADQGLADPSGVFDEYNSRMTPRLLGESIRRTAAAAPDAEAIVVTGAGSRTLALTAALEAEIGQPIVAADTALYWAILKQLGLPAARPFGRLFALLQA